MENDNADEITRAVLDELLDDSDATWNQYLVERSRREHRDLGVAPISGIDAGLAPLIQDGVSFALGIAAAISVDLVAKMIGDRLLSRSTTLSSKDLELIADLIATHTRRSNDPPNAPPT